MKTATPKPSDAEHAEPDSENTADLLEQAMKAKDRADFEALLLDEVERRLKQDSPPTSPQPPPRPERKGCAKGDTTQKRKC